MRKSGILLPLSSLPSPHGIGTLGKAAFAFVDFLAAAGQSLWQILPIGPTGYGDSPYQSFSAMAGNPYFIDLDLLAQNGLLLREEIGDGWGKNPARVDYYLLFKRRFAVLAKAADRVSKTEPAYLAFCGKNAWWLDDYALYMAIKEAYGHVSYHDWPEDLRRRDAAALQSARVRYAPRIEFWRCVQFFFFTQWRRLKRYANARGVEIVGDIPIYVSPDSSDLWAQPELFQVDSQGRPTRVAGVPPDNFSTEGQLWGNPLYDWRYHKRTRYAWWMNRLRYSAELYDITRVDHFRGFSGYYAIPAGAKTAELGVWEKGPGKDFLRTLHRELPHISLIAEDLGFLTQDVHALLTYSRYPGMKILQFAFDSRDESDYLPHNYLRHTVVYTGTHDNTTTEDWQATALPHDVEFARDYLGQASKSGFTDAMIRTALACVADTAVIPMQDWLHLGAMARFNIPSTLGGRNWQWRMLPYQLSYDLAADIRHASRLYGRLSASEKAKEGYEASLVGDTSSFYRRSLTRERAKLAEKAVLLPPPLLTDEEEQRAAREAGIPAFGHDLVEAEQAQHAEQAEQHPDQLPADAPQDTAEDLSNKQDPFDPTTEGE